MYKIIRSESGFSLIEIVIVMGLMSVVGVGTMKMIDQMQKGQNAMRTSVASRDIVEDIKSLLSFPEVCETNFKGKVVGVGMAPINISPIRNGDGAAKFSANQNYDTNTLKLLSIKLGNYSAITDTSGRAEVIIELQKLKQTGTVAVISRAIPVTLFLDNDTDMKVVSCSTVALSPTASPSPSPSPTPSASATPSPSPSPSPTPSPTPSPPSFQPPGLTKEACDELGGRYVVTSQLCIFRKVMVSNNPTATPSSALLSVSSLSSGNIFSITDNGQMLMGLSGSPPSVPSDNPVTAFFSKNIMFGTSLTAESGGYLNGYIGGDGKENDIDIGSLNPIVKTVALFNPTLDTHMSLVTKNQYLGGKLCLGPYTATCGGTILKDGEVSNAGSDFIKVGGNIRVSGTVYMGAQQITSDRRFKTAIHTLTDSLQRLIQLRGVSFQWRAGFAQTEGMAGKNDVGLIAQEVEAVFPEAVDTGPDGTKSIRYNMFTAILIESLKSVWNDLLAEQQARQELESRVKTQEDDMRDLALLVCEDHPDAKVCQRFRDRK